MSLWLFRHTERIIHILDLGAVGGTGAPGLKGDRGSTGNTGATGATGVYVQVIRRVRRQTKGCPGMKFDYRIRSCLSEGRRAVDGAKNSVGWATTVVYLQVAFNRYVPPKKF